MGRLEEPNLLIVEDDNNLGQALVEAFTRKKYKVTLCVRPKDALSAAKVTSFDGAVIDCMLPQMSGLELAKKLRKEWGGADKPMVLISGVYRDKSFSREALSKTGATEFMTKPFDVDNLVGLFENELTYEEKEIEEPIFNLLLKPLASKREKRKALEALESICGFDLPYIYSLIMESNLSGQLVITNEKSEVAGVSFSSGCIVEVDMDDTDTYVGSLLLEKGFISPLDIKEFKSSLNQRKIGERLVSENLVSPHFLPIVFAEQMSIRLGKLIKQNSIKVNFQVRQVPMGDPNIDLEQFTPYLHDWISSKICLEWLISFYRNWMDQIMTRGPEYNSKHPILQMPLIRRLPDFSKNVTSGVTIQQVLDQKRFTEEQIYRALHLMVLRRLVTFDTEKRIDFNVWTKRLKRIKSEFEKKKNHFEALELLGLSRNAHEDEVKRAYREFAKTFHPDKLPLHAPDELKELTAEVFGKVTQMHDVLTDPKAREKYRMELEEEITANSLESESLLEQGKSLMKSGKIKSALEFFERTAQLSTPSGELKLLILWCKLKGVTDLEEKQKIVDNMENELLQIPPEERHSAVYFFVKGLYQAQLENYEMAEHLFEQAVSVDPKFIDARRELNIIKLKGKGKGTAGGKSKGLLQMDLKDVMGELFKKAK